MTGEIDWKKKVGNGGLLGGIHFGMATDSKKLYVPISDRWVNRDYDKKAKPGLYALDFLKGRNNLVLHTQKIYVLRENRYMEKEIVSWATRHQYQ